MSKTTSYMSSSGDTRSKSPRHAHKNRNKGLKSNITNKMGAKRSKVVVSSGVESEDGDGDSSSNDEYDDANGDPDVSALLGAHNGNSGETMRRLAGRDDEDALAGADEPSPASSDGIYDEIENISDEDEFSAPGMPRDSDESNDELRAAEPELVQEFMMLSEQRRLARSLGLDATGDVNLNEDPFHGIEYNKFGPYAEMAEEAEFDVYAKPTLFRNPDNGDTTFANQKRVRFEEVQMDESSASDTEDEDEDDDVFPDLLDAAAVPGLNARIARGLAIDDSVDLNDFNDAESCYDFDGEDERLAFEIDEESDTDEDMSSQESDDGDTTDEESPEEQMARIKEIRKAQGGASIAKAQRIPMRVAASIPSSPSTSRPSTPHGAPKTPRAGTFKVDPTRATITTDAAGKKIILQPPATPLEKDKAFWDRAKTANNSRDGSPLTRPAPVSDSMPIQPFTTQSTLGGMFQGNLEMLRNYDSAQIMDELPIDDTAAAFLTMQTSLLSTAADTELEIEEDINMQDFLDISDSDSDTDAQENDPFSPGADSDWFGSTDDMSTTSRRGSDLLGHFDQYRGIVGSFRFNQNQVKHVSSLALHPAQRASTHEYNALQKGRRGAANTPMTPARKKRISQDITPNSAGVRKGLSSPLTARRPRSRGNSLGGIAANNLFQTLSGNPFDQGQR